MGALHDDGDTLVLLGTGAGFWPGFAASPEFDDGAADPLDRWSERTVGRIATDFGAEAVYPFGGPPYEPFIAWAKASGRFSQSPVGMLIHDTVGLMISLRGALRVPGRHPLPQAGGSNPCDTCRDRPCLTACPVGALSGDAPYDVAACKSHVGAPAGTDCLTGGCLVRRACPVQPVGGRDPAQSAFHMRAFMGVKR